MAENDVAKLGFSIDATDALLAGESLRKLTRESRETEDAANKLGKTFGRTSSEIDRGNSSISKTSTELNKTSTAAKSSESSLSKLKGTIGGLVAGYVSFSTVMAGVNKLFDETVSLELLDARLKTATGSAANAKIAFAAIKDFATETPFDLNQVTDSFTKLVNYGLTPSERALRSYGDTSSALGKTMEQMIEAVADAATGQFERLKEFGIKSSKEGDVVKFTFRGVTESVRNDAASIEEYLIKLGENNFGGSMAAQMDTLGGAASNLGDAWQSLFMAISRAGSGEIMKETIRAVTTEIQNLEASISSGQFEAYVDAIVSKFDGYGQSIAAIMSLFDGEIAASEYSISETIKFLTDAFVELPENVKAMIQILTVEFASGFDKFLLNAEAVKDRLKAIFTDDTIDNVNQRLFKSLDGVDKVRNDSIDTILKERDAAIKSYDDQIKKADELRKKFDDAAVANRPSGDRLSPFKIGGGSPLQTAAPTKQEADSLEKLRSGLLSEEAEIQNSFKKRQDELAAYLAKDSGFKDEYYNLSLANLKNYNEQIASLEISRNKERVGYLANQINLDDELYAQKIDKLNAFHQQGLISTSEYYNEFERLGAENRDRLIAQENERFKLAQEQMKLARESGIASIIPYHDLEAQLAQQHEQNLYEISKKGLSARQKLQETSFNDQLKSQLGALSQFTSAAAQHDKKLFEANKIVSIANAAMSMYEGANAALEWGWPLGPVFAGLIIASGLKNIQAIKNQQFSSATSAAPSVSSAGTVPIQPVNYSNTETNLANQQGSGITFNIYGDISGNDAEKLFDDFKELVEKRDKLTAVFSKAG